MELDLSNFQVWISMQNGKESMEKYLCFQTINKYKIQNLKKN